MSDVIISPNMNLPVPIVGQDPGPQYATDVNSCLALIDQHNHASGSGVPITPNGLNINAALSFAGNDATNLRTTRYTSQVTPIPASSPDLMALYVSGVDLYYNDGSGNQVRITQSGGVAGSPGSISNLTSPASASYVSGSATFVWQSAANTAANMDNGSVTIREVAPNANGITLQSPSGLAANYGLTFPAALPAGQRFTTIDNSGNIAASWNVDNSTLDVSGNLVEVKASGITATQLASNSVTTAKILDGAVTAPKLAANNNAQTSPNTVALPYAGGADQGVTGVVTLTASGTRPVILVIQPPASNSISCQVTGAAGTQSLILRLYKDGSAYWSFPYYNSFNLNDFIILPGFLGMDFPTAGAHTYQLIAQLLQNNGTTITFTRVAILAYEI